MIAMRHCIVCGRPIRKRTHSVAVRTLDGRGFDRDPPVTADLRTRADCLRHTNQPHVISFKRWKDGLIYRFNVWDGESFEDEFFCTNNCAMDMGRAAAHLGHRFKWKSRT